MPRLSCFFRLAVVGVLLGVSVTRADDPPAPWSASITTPSQGSGTSVAEWAATKFATPQPADEPRKLKVGSEAVVLSPPPKPDTLATPAPAVGDRYTNPRPMPAAPPRLSASPLAAGNPLRGAGEPKIQLRSGELSDEALAARNAFTATLREPKPTPTASPAPAKRIAVGAAPLRAETEPTIAIADEAFLPTPSPNEPFAAAESQPNAPPAAWKEEPAKPLRVAAATPVRREAPDRDAPPQRFSEPAAFSAPAPEPAFSSQPTEGVGRPGPTQLEGPQEASLVVEKRGPREVRIGQQCRFVVKVRNTGTGPADNVVLTDQVPAGARLISTSPNADDRDGRLVWRLGKLPAGEERMVEVRLEPVREGPLGSVATVSMDASASASTTCTRPALAVQMSAPERARVGDEQRIAIEVHNPGTGAATNVLLVEDVPPELRHAAGPELEYVVGTLEPGETRRIELSMQAERAGHVVNRVEVVADGDLRAERTVEFEVVAPSLAVSIDGPQRRYLERPASYKIGVNNPGTATAKDVRLVTHLPRGMEFVKANNLGEYDATSHSVYWSLAELPEGERGEVEVTAMPVTAGDHTLRVESETADGLKASGDHRVRVTGVSSLAFEVRDLNDPIEVGDETVYEIRVLNEGTKSATGVRVLVEAPGGMRIVAAQGQTAGRVAAGRAEFAPLPQLAPGEKVAYRVRVAGVEPGDQRVTVLVESDDLTRPIRREESTRVFGDE